MRCIPLIVFTTALSVPAIAAEPDFYLEPIDCKSVLGYVDDGSVKVVEADPPSYECARQGSTMECTIRFDSGGKPRKAGPQKYRVVIDSPPILLFTVENGSDTVFVNTSKSSAVITTRLAEMQYSGSKVCSAVFATKFQIDRIREQQRKPKP